ncbi:response regulator [Sulfitobacter sp. HNIBRBA2951]|uniref:response regulator n=1 Tax=Sulfitobacter aquimarinus TaxID=3158557 RepID=UPI0032E04B2A
MSLFSHVEPTAQQLAGAAPTFASILIVDDQRFDRTRLKKLCGTLGFNTHLDEADSLQAMHDRLSKERFDLILLDYHLTDGTGLQGVDAIRADPVNKGAAIIMITGTENSDVALQALTMGFSDYLTKDELSEETLQRAAITALQKAQLTRGMARKSTKEVQMHDTLRSFSRECAKDIKPIVSRMMRQMRELREIDQISPEDAVQRVERVEGSLRRLWNFLEDLDELGAQSPSPTVSGVRSTNDIQLRVPSHQPVKANKKLVRTPSVFRRRPD